MKIRLLSWESEGLRCTDAKVDMSVKGKVPRVFLLQMPNGTGKTTILNMIRAALTGEARSWPADFVKQHRRPGDTRTQGRFILRLDVDSHPLTFEMVFDFIDGKVSYRTSTPGGGGVTNDWEPPAAIHRFLSSEFVHLFVFDGELAERLLDSNYPEAVNAIDALCQLYLLDEVCTYAEHDWQRLTKKPGPKAQAGLNAYRSKEDALDKQLKRAINLRKGVVKRLAEIEKDGKELDESVGTQMKQIEGDQKQLQQLKLTEQQKENDVASANNALMASVRQPHLLHPAFFEGLRQLKASLDKAKLPESSSRQFFVELSEQGLCVCGRPISEHERKVILEHASKYLGEEVAGVLNALKRDIDTHVVNADVGAQDMINNAAKELKVCVTQWTQARAAREAHEAALVKKGGDKLQEQKERLIKLGSEGQNLKDLLADEIDRSYSPHDDEKTNCLASLKHQLEEIRKKIAEISDTVELRQKTDILNSVLTKAKQDARENLRRALVDECNGRLEKILSRDPVRIRDISQSIILHHQDGASVGQTLAVGYTFLASLLHRGQHEFPLIVDSPANPIDIHVRREIGALIPTLCEQFIGLTISTEREGFVASLEKGANGDVGYATAFRITEGTKPLLEGLPKTGVTRSKNACLVLGKEYFCNFDLEAQGEEN